LPTALQNYLQREKLSVRRFSGTDLIANYSQSEIIEVSTNSMFMVNNTMTKHFGFEEEWQKTTDLFLEWNDI
jgi:hypothetical protein